jgi:hypothetical protein
VRSQRAGAAAAVAGAQERPAALRERRPDARVAAPGAAIAVPGSVVSRARHDRRSLVAGLRRLLLPGRGQGRLIVVGVEVLHR